MNFFKLKAKPKEPIPAAGIDPVAESIKITEQTLRNERAFWDEIIRCSINSDNPPSEVIRHTMNIADTLLEERRKRFPVREKPDGYF